MGGVIDGVDVSLISPTSGSYNSTQSLDAAHLISPQFIPSLNSPNCAPQFAAKNARRCYSYNLPFVCECGSISGTSQAQSAAQFSHSIHTQQLPTPQGLSPAQQCAFPPTPGTIHGMGASTSTSTHFSHIPVQDQLPQHWLPEANINSEDSSISYSDVEVDSINTDKAPTDHSHSTNPPTTNITATTLTEKAANLETHFTHILDTIEEAGFDSIDSMATA
jgi:hypothetical protein